MKLKNLSIITSILFYSPLFGGFDTMPELQSNTHDTINISNKKDITISWSQASANSGDTLKGYYYILDTNSSTLIPNIVNTRKSVGAIATSITENASNDGEYYFHLAPYAESGNTGATLHFGPIKIDTTSPIISISPNGGTFSQTQTISIDVNDINRDAIYYTLDGSEPITSEENATNIKYSGSFDLSSSKTLKVIAIDLAGNESSVKVSNFTINVTTNIAIFGSEVNPNSVIAVSGDSAVTELSVDGASITHYKYKVDSGSYSSEVTKNTKINLTSLNEGQHTISIIGYDGNIWQSEATANTLTFSVNNSALPDDVTFSLKNGSNITTNSTINLTSSSDTEIYYTLDGTIPDKNANKGKSISITSIHNGDLTLKAVAYDTNENRSKNIATATYKVNITSQNNNNNTNSGSNNINSEINNNTNITTNDFISIPNSATSTINGDTQIIKTENLTLSDGTISTTNTTIAKDGSISANVELLINGEKVTTSIKAVNGAKVVIGEDGTIKNTLTLKNITSEIVAKQNGEVEVNLNSNGKSSNFKVLKGATIELKKDGSVTTTNQVNSNFGKVNIQIEANTNGNLSATSTLNSGQVHTLSVPNSASEQTIEIVDNSLKATFKISETLNLSTNKRVLKSVNLKGDSIEITPLSAWQKYEQNLYFDGNQSIKLLLGEASFIIDEKEIKIERNVEYILTSLEIKNTNQVFIDNKLNLKKGWNLLASPINKKIEDISIFGDFNTIYTYSNLWSENPKSIEIGVGFWINMNEDKNISFEGDEYKLNLNDSTSWKLIGTGSDMSEINATTLSFYNNKWYKNASTIYKGQGFWIKSNDIKINRGWNLISNPKLKEIDSNTFENAKEIYVFRDNTWVKNPTTIKPLEGIWINSNKYEGFDLNQFTINDFHYSNSSTWQLLGTPIDINSTKVYDESKCEKIWTYNSEWYEIERDEEIKGGSGFWVK